MAALSKAEYLKRYMSKSEVRKEEKKKKVKKVKKRQESKIQIIDDDIGLNSLKPVQDEEFALLEEEKPQVAEVIDERPKHIQDLEAYRKDSRWKLMARNDEDGGSDDLDYGVIHSGNRDSAKVKGQSVYDSSSSRGGRRQRHDSSSCESSPPRGKNSSQSKRNRVRHDSDSDMSPPRGKSSLSSPHRKSTSTSFPSPHQGKRKRMDSDSDESPPRKSASGAASKDRSKKNVGNDSDSDQSPPRSRQAAADSDQSPARRMRGGSGSDQSPPRTKKTGSDSDQSPPRRKRGGFDSDQSPPRKKKGGSDSDQSPPRKRRGGSDSDQSPPRQKSRKNKHDSGQSPSRKGGRQRNSRWGSSPVRGDGDGGPVKKPTKTLSGAKAGLSTAAEMREEARKLKEKEDRAFRNIDEETLGRHAKTVVRDKQTGRRKNTQEDDEREKEEERRKEELAKKYEQWGKGLKQQAVRDAALEEQVHEASKPLARYQDDKDLDTMLREEERMEDPMLAYIKKKKKKKEDDAAEKSGLPKKKELPKYSGATPPPLNRFNIWPGYRWDGVDRSNGFEKKIFAKAAERKAVKEIAYKWSTEDM